MILCERCLWAIESREGRLAALLVWADDSDENGATDENGAPILCEWCENQIQADNYYKI